MSYQPDSFKASLVWGRIGAAVISLVAFVLSLFGYAMTPEDQEATAVLITSVLSGVAGVLAIISKIREAKKLKEE